MPKKTTLLIVLAVFLLISGIACLAYFLTRPVAQSTRLAASLPTPGLVAALDSTAVQTPLATLEPTPTPAPTKTPWVTGSIWSVIKIENDTYASAGFVYDVATFKNEVTGQIVTAQCAEPGWPTPPLGTTYRLNEAGVLIPVSENAKNPFQRFLVFDF